MDTEARAVQLRGIQMAPDQEWPAPEQPLEDSILLIYSVAHTAQRHLAAAEEAVTSYRRPDIRKDRRTDPNRLVRTRPERFRIPASSGPASTLNSELVGKLVRCVGAIAFVDDMRPNIAYELGFFHGKGSPVLLLASTSPEPSWSSLSDLAGSAVRQFTDETLPGLIREYLDDLFLKLEKVEKWPSYTFPDPSQNLLAARSLRFTCKDFKPVKKGGFGGGFRLFTWDCPLNIRINRLLSDDAARFKLAVRSPDDAHFSVYFELQYEDSDRVPRQVWLGLSSWLERGDYRNDERNIPTDPANKEWRFVTGTFKGLQRQAHLPDIAHATLKRVRLRAGQPGSRKRCAVEFGYLEINGCM